MPTQTSDPQRLIAGRYLVREQIGQGRMSTVYLALDRGSGDAKVAVKILNTSHPDEIKRALYERETAALRRLAHPNIVRLRSAGWSDEEGAFYLVLDYLPFALDRLLAGKEPQLRTPDPHRVIRELGAALVLAHSGGVVHRDIKPSNILLDDNGRAMLTDFGISKLLDQLTVGETLAGFFSTGYASPEQRAARPTDPRSDVYSLGAVYYHMLSGLEPPPEGPTPELVDRHVQLPNRLMKRTLKSMLATDPDARPQGGVELPNALNVTYRLEKLPRYFLIVTNSAVNDIASSDYGPSRDLGDVAAVISEDLGGQEHVEICAHMDRHQPEDVILLGDSLRFICAKASEGDALAIKAVQQPYMPRFDAEKSNAMAMRAVCVPVQGAFRATWDATTLSRARHDLSELLSSLASHARAGITHRQQRNSRREFIERWQRALVRLRRRIESDSGTVQYSRVEQKATRLHFTLTQDPPNDIWEEDTPLMVRGSGDARSAPVGNFVQVRGKVVEVAESRSGRDQVPPAGTLTANVIEVLAENDRQQRAVNSFLVGEVANPDLATAIVDPSLATRGSVTELDYFQSWLSPDKKQAVAEALASNELFMIQGPPGTGKTSVIAEIVLQILEKKPKARILLSSQSNVAVDHALTRIAAAAEGKHGEPPTMVRIGRENKIGYGGEKWTLSARARSLREEIIGRCTPTLDKLKRDERRAREAAKAESDLAETELFETGELGELILEAEELVAQLEEYEHEEASIHPNASESTVVSAKALVDDARAKAQRHIEAVGDLLSRQVDLTGLSPREALNAVTTSAVPSRRGHQADDPAAKRLLRIQELRKVLSQWTRVAGRGSDFEELVGKSSSVVAATCSISGRIARNSGPEVNFDWAIIDEAGRATVPEVLVPIVKAQRVVLVGDERQLPPMIEQSLRDPNDAAGDSLDQSLFQALVAQVKEATPGHLASLRSQYRMRPSIGALISDVFYDGKLENGDTAQRPNRAYDWLPARVTWFSTSDERRRQESRIGYSFLNVMEADVAGQLLRRFESEVGKHAKKLSVGVIAAYAGQVAQINATIDPGNLDRWRKLDIEVATVDSFQGRERDIVIYSTVRSNPRREIGFQRDLRRVNVALSRAREVIAIVGDLAMMEGAQIGTDNPLARVVDYMRANTEDCRIVPAQGLRFL